MSADQAAESHTPEDEPVDRALIDAARILIVDDDAFISAMAHAYLEHAGFSRIETADDGQSCLDRLNDRESEPPDIVILDIRMPVIDGLEVLRQMRADPALQDLPVLVTTGLDESAQRNEAIRAGANSLISKPFDAPLLIEKTRSLLERQVLIQQLNLYRSRVSQELDMARELQLSLLPTEDTIQLVAERYRIRVSSQFHSSSELAGDFWGVEPLDDNRLAVFMVDIAGHGVAAAANTFRLHEILQSEDMVSRQPDAFMAQVNQRFHARIPPGHFATILYGVIDLTADTFTYASAAAPPPLVGHREAGEPRFLENRGLLAGAIASASYTSYTVPFRPGDYLFLYSDALPEAMTPEGALLGDDAPAAMLREALDTNPLSPLLPLLQSFRARTVSPLQDDLTLVFLSREKARP